MKKKLIAVGIFGIIFMFDFLPLQAQFSLSGQIRPRSEFRDGQGAPLSNGLAPAFFISQRTRLIAGFKSYRLKFGLSLQDVRLWGQDVSTINQTTTQNNNGLMLHEAWAEILLTDTTLKNKALSLKIGRQELVYDDQRLIGNLDWLQQARTHDAAVLKYETYQWMIHLAGAFNQNTSNSSGTIYYSTPPGNYAANTNGGSMYKSMEFLYIGKKLANGNVSFLFFTDQFNKYTTDSNATKIFQTGVWGRATTGLYFNDLFLNSVAVTASTYYQFGKNATGQPLSSYLLSGFAKYIFNKKINTGIGIDYTSGGKSGNTSNTFDPLYGTPHKFWGLMDYYYAASPFGKGGLVDVYLKTKYTPSEKFWITADLHSFSSATSIVNPNNLSSNEKGLGTELDFVGSYSITKQVNIESGYSHYFSTALLTSPNVKNIANARSGANWAYLMLDIKPEFFFK